MDKWPEIRIAYVIPTIPTREDKLQRAIASIEAQTWPVDYIAVQMDDTRSGASATRNKALRKALDWLGGDPDDRDFGEHDWIGFLDDDDELLPNHCEYLITEAEKVYAYVAIGWYNVVGGRNPFPPDFRGRTYDPDAPHCTPITYMARAFLVDLALEFAGGFDESVPNTGYWSQDERMLSYMVRRGGHVSLSEPTWNWHMDGENTSGRPDNVKWPD